MDEAISTFLEEISPSIDLYRRLRFITRADEILTEALETLERDLVKARNLKNQFAGNAKDDSANAMLSLENSIGYFVNELKMWIALKRDEPDAAWSYLCHAEAAARTAMQAHELSAMFGDDFARLEGLERFLFPPQIFFSLGFVSARSKCSVCASEYGSCDHVAGRAYNGQICVRILTEITKVDHVAVVKQPASKGARVTAISVDGAMRDTMTWRVSPSLSKKEDIR